VTGSGPELTADRHARRQQLVYGNTTDGSPTSTVTTGAIGPIGATGATGASGPQGISGTNGTQGPAGSVGPAWTGKNEHTSSDVITIT
jgi:hypothetical protein